MTFDWDAFNKLSDDEKIEYLKKVEEEALDEAKGKTYPPGSIAPEKARHQEGSEVVGRMNPDGTIHHYSGEEKRAEGIEDDTTDTTDQEDE